MTVTNEADKGSSPGDMGKAVTVAVERWCYDASFEVLPTLFKLLAELGIEWRMLDAWPLKQVVSIETDHEVVSSWRPVSLHCLERCWTKRHDGGPCEVKWQMVTIEDADAYEALVFTRDAAP